MSGHEQFDPEIFQRVLAERARGETGHVESTDVHRSVDVPEGLWVDVRAGQRTAEGTVTRAEWPGLLFDADDPTKVICWHLTKKIFTCNRRNIRPEQVVLEEGSGAPWCPTCLSVKKKLAKKARTKSARRERTKQKKRRK